MTIYVVGQSITGSPWAISGVFDSIEKAEKACTDHTFFVGPMELNYDVGPGESDWPGIYFPKAGPPHNKPKDRASLKSPDPRIIEKV